MANSEHLAGILIMRRFRLDGKRVPPAEAGLGVSIYGYPGLKSPRENQCRPRGTRYFSPLYPALRLRLRAGL